MTVQQFLTILLSRKRLFVAVFVLVLLLVVVASLLLPKKYLAQAVIAVDAGNADPVSLTMANLSGQNQNYLGTQASMLASHNSARKVVQTLKLTQFPAIQASYQASNPGPGDNIVDWLATILLSNLTVEAGKGSSTLTLSYKATDPQFAAAVLNAFVDAYKSVVVDSRVEMAKQNEAFFQTQLEELKQTMAQKQQQLADYQREHGLIEAPDERLDLENQKLNFLASEVAQAQGELTTAKSKLTELSHGAAPDVMANPVIQQMTLQLAQQEKLLSEAAQREGPNHPNYKQAAAQVVATRAQLNKLKKEYSTMMRSQVETTQSRVDSLNTQLDQQKKTVLDMKGQLAQLDIMRRGVENAQRNFDLLMQRWSESMLQANASMTNVTVLQRAIPPTTPVSPVLKFNLLIGTVLALFCAAALNYGLEWLDRRVRCIDDVERDLGVPVLIALGAERQKKKAVNKLPAPAGRLVNQEGAC
ncbi:Wzz/FepE/Etk N-terminal domain-containing protein [Pseudaeromonas sp. ZJS20]|uniref:Wzz/FepE/Etk N-terminal domain-containing protein n=1 Tax=Pseudaeromonas aegiceratis TaxID=3153928 RepID=UPI00390C9104